jgi:uncharacterized membrane protein
MMWDGNGSWGHSAAWGVGGWLVGIGMIFIVVAVVLLVVYLVRNTTTHQAPLSNYPAIRMGSGPPAVESARDIVQRRYASGEIEREEYLQKLGDL